MYQDIEDNIDVIALFEHNHLQPCRFRWRGKIYRIDQVTGAWQKKIGEKKLRYFAIVDSMSNFFQLCYDERNTSWKISKVWVE